MRWRIATLLLVLAQCVAFTAHAARTGTVQPCAPSKPHEVHTFPGFITVHIECDRVLLEIPTAMLGRDMLMATEFAALSTGSSEYAPGTSVSNRVVRWLRRGNRVYADVPRFDAWARNAPSLQEGIQEAALPTVLAALDVVREGDDGAAIVDVTPLFTNAVPAGFALEFMRHYHMISVDPTRSYVQTVRAFPTNLEFGYYQTWTADRQELLKHAGDDDAPPTQVAFAFRTNLLLLPEQPMVGRVRQPRPAARFETNPAVIGGPAPRVGEHSRAVDRKQGHRLHHGACQGDR